MSEGIVIRTAKPDEWEALKQVRLQALQDAPASFGERYEDAVQKDDEEWKQYFTKVIYSEHQDILFAVDGSRVIGMMLLFTRDLDQKIGGIGGLWVAPEYRQKGLGRRLVETGLEWMRTKKLLAVTFWNNKSGEASSKFYERLGFTYTGIEKPLESNPDFTIGEMRKDLGEN